MRDRDLPPARRPLPSHAGSHLPSPSLAHGTRQLNAEYAMLAARSSGYFGSSHAEALVSLLGEGNVPHPLIAH